MKKLRLIVLALASLLALQANSQIYTQGFNGGSLPSGWGVTVTNTTATLPAITFETASVHPTGLAPSEGTHMVRFNSYSCQSSGSIRLAQTTPIATTGGFAGVAVSFDWSTDDEYPNNDVVVVQYSLDGTTWVDINSYSRAGGATVSWNSISCPLPVAAINKPAVYIGLHFISAYGNDCYLDNLKVIGSTSLLYCESASTSAADEDILNVTFAGINNTSTCSTTGGLGSILNKYSNYYKTVTPATVFAGSSYPISIQIGTCGTSNYRNMVKVYFDFNQDGDFSDADETAYVSGSSTLGPHTETASILIPATAVADTIPMRIVNVETTFDTDIAPCGAYNYGETEDYAVIVTIPSCLAPTNIIVSGVTHNFALVNWTEAGTATKWNIQYGPSGFTLGTGTFIHNVPATNSGIGGFSPSTAYDIYIQDSCGPGDNSVWAGPISFTTAPTCPAPSAVTLGVYTATMANINWTENGSATTWQIEVGLAGYTPGSGTKNNTIIRPNSIGPLLPNTTYDVRVRSICSPGDTSLWSSPMSFTTKCTYYTVPYIETFETSSTNCWSVTDIDLDGIVWEVSPIGNHTLAGSYCAYHNYNGSIMQDGYLISPEIITPTSANTKLSFWSYNSFVADYDKNSVLISRDGGSTFTEVWSPASVVNSWAKDSIDITSYNNDTIIIAFRYEGQNAHRWLVDDIRVDQTISYNISTTKANVKACDTLGISSLPIDITNAGTTIIPMGQSIDISYKIDGGSVVTNTINLAAALNPGATTTANFTTPYHFNLFTTYNCMMAVSIAGDPTRANDTTRFTLSINHKPIVNLGHDTTLCLASSILLNAYDPAASSYYWWNGTVTPGYNINSTFCGGAPGTCSFWVAVTDTNTCVGRDTIALTWTICSGIDEETEHQINLMPNPTYGAFTIDFGGLTSLTSVEIYDPNGRLVMSEQLDLLGTETRNYDLSSYAKGLYSIRIINNDKVSVKKLMLN